MRGPFMKFGILAIGALLLAMGAFLLVPTQNTARAADDADYQRMKLFTEVLTEIESKYVEKKSPNELITSAIKGMVADLDPHSAYLSPEEYKDLQVETKGSFFGVGIEITTRDGVLTVVSPIEGTPAYIAGVEAGDRIIKIDGKLTKGMSLMDAVKAIRGTKGTKVVLTVLRDGEHKLKDIAIVRDLIPLHSITSYLIEDGFGYIRISTFQEDTTRDLVKALRKLQTQKKPLVGLVLDLRNDPGGLLQQAIGVADQFLDQGIIVSTRGPAAQPGHGLQGQLHGDLGRLPGGLPGQQRLGQRQRDRGRSLAGPQTGGHHGHHQLRQGLGTDHHPPGGRRSLAAHHRPLLHPRTAGPSRPRASCPTWWCPSCPRRPRKKSRTNPRPSAKRT